jgi:hypothetical protein
MHPTKTRHDTSTYIYFPLFFLHKLSKFFAPGEIFDYRKIEGKHPFPVWIKYFFIAVIREALLKGKKAQYD